MIKLEKLTLAVEGGFYFPQSVELKEGHGLVGDKAAGKDERQICMLDAQVAKSVENLNGLCTKKFVGNFLTTGLDYKSLEVGKKFKVGNAEIEIIQRGKKCYPECELIIANKQCDLPRGSAFAKITKSGTVKVGNELVVK